ncbi:hypothetical protein MTR_7g034035 [Medicago truncatula]|uniref:Uncharacterized protein n=1 Tax=Medicago truncatula TaxID=3880 RepID=A0A072TZ84_MEDTR|nr:hypothetical protein MTR_7g034035 [Medicago truncatula]
MSKEVETNFQQEVKKYSIKNESSISREPEKAGLAKNERLGGLKTRKGGPGKN